MTRLQLSLTSLVAVIPAAIFAIIMALSIMSHAGNMSTILWVANGIAGLCSVAIIAIPFVIGYQSLREKKAEKLAEQEAAAEKAAAETGEVDELADETAEAGEEAPEHDVIGEDFFDDGDDIPTEDDDVESTGFMVTDTMTGEELGLELGQDTFDDDSSSDDESGVMVTESTDDIGAFLDDDADTADALEAYTGPSEEEALAETGDFNLDDDLEGDNLELEDALDVEESDEISVTESSVDAIAATGDFDLDSLGEDTDEDSADAMAATSDFDLDELGGDAAPESTLSGLHDSLADNDDLMLDDESDVDATAVTSDFDMEEMGLADKFTEENVNPAEATDAEVAEDDSADLFDDSFMDDEIESDSSDAAVVMDEIEDDFDDDEEDLFIEGYDDSSPNLEDSNVAEASTDMFEMGEEDEDLALDSLNLDDDTELDANEEDIAGDFLMEEDAAPASEQEIVIEDSGEIDLDVDGEDEPVMIVEESNDEIAQADEDLFSNEIDWDDDDEMETNDEIPVLEDPAEPEVAAEDVDGQETLAELDLDNNANDLEATETIIAFDDGAEEPTSDDDVAQTLDFDLDDEEVDEIDFDLFDDDEDEEPKPS